MIKFLYLKISSITSSLLNILQNSTLFGTNFPLVKTTPKVRGCGTDKVRNDGDILYLNVRLSSVVMRHLKA